MTRRILAGGLMLIALGAGGRGGDPPAKAAPTHPGLERLKKLAGTWVAADKDGKPTDKVVSVIKVTAGGSRRPRDAVPRPAAGDGVGLPPGRGRPGDDPLLRAGQPAADEGRPEVAGRTRSGSMFAGGTNLDPAKDMHMHEATLTFVDDDHIEITGVAWEDGKPCRGPLRHDEAGPQEVGRGGGGRPGPGALHHPSSGNIPRCRCCASPSSASHGTGQVHSRRLVRRPHRCGGSTARCPASRASCHCPRRTHRSRPPCRSRYNSGSGCRRSSPGRPAGRREAAGRVTPPPLVPRRTRHALPTPARGAGRRPRRRRPWPPTRRRRCCSSAPRRTPTRRRRTSTWPAWRSWPSCLKPVPGVEVTVVKAEGPWKDGPELVGRSDGVVLFLTEGAKWLSDDAKRLAAFRELAKRGGGLVCLHWGMGTREAGPIDGVRRAVRRLPRRPGPQVQGRRDGRHRRRPEAPGRGRHRGLHRQGRVLLPAQVRQAGGVGEAGAPGGDRRGEGDGGVGVGAAGRRAVVRVQRAALPRQLEAGRVPPAGRPGGAVGGRGAGAREGLAVDLAEADYRLPTKK